MNKIVKIYDFIDLLKYGNRPKIIKLDGNIYEYDEKSLDYRDKNDFPLVINILDYYKKIEILVDKDIEKLESYPDVLNWKKENGIDKALEEQATFNEEVFNKLNELSEEVNKLKKNNNEK